MTSNPTVCMQCSSRSCEKSPIGELNICEFGVAYCVMSDGIQKKETLVPLRLISTNLRHELHRYLAVIVQNVVRLDPKISRNTIDPTKPLDCILGSTVIIDHFVQILTGVNDLHIMTGGAQDYEPYSIASLVRKYFSIYSIVRNERRAKNLVLDTDGLNGISVAINKDVLEYVVSVLMDNIWKYSIEGSTVTVSALSTTEGTTDIIFQNHSSPIPKDIDIFARGTQGDGASDGFGYGLYWAQILVDHYNLSRDAHEHEHGLQLTHHEEEQEETCFCQSFIIRNIPHG